jgi:hypothetical protein
MRLTRSLITLLAVATLAACTPDELARLDAFVAWYHGQQDQAAAAGRPCAQYAGDIAFRGLPSHFLEVIDRESNCTPTAVNRSSGALGLTQVMPSWIGTMCALGIRLCTRSELLDPYTNLDAAAHIYDVQGPDAWVT